MMPGLSSLTWDFLRVLKMTSSPTTAIIIPVVLLTSRSFAKVHLPSVVIWIPVFFHGVSGRHDSLLLRSPCLPACFLMGHLDPGTESQDATSGQPRSFLCWTFPPNSPLPGPWSHLLITISPSRSLNLKVSMKGALFPQCPNSVLSRAAIKENQASWWGIYSLGEELCDTSPHYMRNFFLLSLLNNGGKGMYAFCFTLQ